MLLQATGINKSYGNLNVLKNVSLSIDKGEFVAIVGPSGADKSTLLHILGLLDPSDSGTVNLNQQNISALSKNKLAQLRNKHIGFVFQSHHLLPEFSAQENVAMPLFIAGNDKNKALEQAKTILTKVGLGHRLTHKPNELSGGEQQRVAIARAIIQNPEIIFADEPTGNLDTQTAAEINQLFVNLVEEQGICLIIVTHNTELAGLAHRVIQMKDGSIVADTKR